MSEQVRSPNRRPYRMERRSEHVARTRQRIVEATVRLHTTIGPARTSIAAIADEAEVTRLTVYRHFRDLDELFAACRAHWDAGNPGPDPEAWRSIPALAERAGPALRQLYGWYRAHAEELFPIMRDFATMPGSTQAAMAAQSDALADALVDGHADGPDGRLARALAGHLVAFSTWRSLAVDQGLADADAADLGARLLVEITGGSAA